MIRHKFNIGIAGYINIKKEVGSSSLKSIHTYINRPDYVIKKLQVIRYSQNNPFDAITAVPVDTMEYPKAVVGLA